MNARSSKRFGALRRRVALASAVVMVGTLLQAVTQPALAADDGRGRPDLPASEKPVPGTIGKVRPRTVMKAPRTPQAAPDAAWPKTATARVELPPADAKPPTASVRAKGLPLTLDTRVKTGRKPARGPVEARVLSREAAKRAGVDGLLFTLRPESTSDMSQSGRVRAKVDYSGFADAFGGGYASRLTLVELPACALTAPDKKECRTSEPVATVNDTEKQTLTAQDVTLSAGSTTVLAAVAGTVSENGDYKATSLAPSSAWSTNLNTGDFSWSYNMPVPEVPGGLTPNVGLSYSSGSIDGRTGNTNNQASWAGDGFDLWPGYIERRYKPCSDDDVKNADGHIPGDVCWAYDNAFITFNGKGGELVPNGTDSFRLKDDDGTKIDRLTSSARGNGDDNGEYWRLTTPDGTHYYFGFNRLPGWTDGKETTDSTWTVPVFGDDTAEPCHASAFADSWCQQAWRWNLDYVVDTHGNAIAYYYNKETNSYGRNLEATDNTPYERGGTLDRIEYGLKSSSMYGTKALAKVAFTNNERCLPDTSTTCSDIEADGFYWYDTPWDLNCDTAEDCDQGRVSPVFFTRKRLTEVSTQVYDGSVYKDVDSWKLTHRWGMADTDYQLLLDSVQRTGHTADPAITLPKTTFAYTQLANRLDKTGDGYAPFIKDRLSSVADESGGQIDVNYSAPVCDWDSLPTPETNATRCFPQYIGGSVTDDPERQWFNKYVVASVTATDRTGGAPDQVTAYDYMGGAAWHYDDDDGLTKEKFKTWSQWRGYGQVRVQTGGQGGASEMKKQSDTYFLRGMDGDRKDTSGGTKSVTVSLSEGAPITDHESVAGFAYKTVSYSGPGGKVLAKTVNRPWHHETAKKVRDWGTVTANLTGTSLTQSFTSLDDGAGAKWRTTSRSNTYDTVAGRITQVDDFGDDNTATDDRCTRTTYATNTTDNILTLSSRVETVAKACDKTVSRPDDVISDVRTAYDGGTYSEVPAKGDATASAVLKKYDGTTALYLESGASYDSYGRPTTSTDLTADVTVSTAGVITRTVRTDGRTTTTERTPTTGFATSVKVATPPVKAGDTATAQTSTTTHDILRGQALTQADTNGKATNFAYDALGRSAKVWLADRLTGQTPTYEFTYTVSDGKPVAVGTKTLGNNGVQRTSYSLYDGFLRPRQAQDPGPDGGRLLTDTFYDERGLVAKEFATYYTNGAPATDLFKPADALAVETQNRYSYDGLGRQIEAKQIAGNGDGGTVLATTRTIYGGDRVTVIPPVGGTATTTLTDARGQTTELRQHHSRTAEAAYDTTSYAYTPRGELKKLTDTAGSDWIYTYDLLGRQTKATDPDKGATTSTYDDRGQLTTTTDARETTLAYKYDDLGRQTELRQDSATGTLRASWTYDTISGAKGQLAETTRYDGASAYTTKVVAYDRLYRPTRTSVTIPASEGALQGTYISTTTYNVSGTIQGVGYPKAGSLAAATVAYTYEDDTLRPIAVTGSQGVKATTNYSLTGKPLQYELSNSAGKRTWVSDTYEWGTQRLATTRVDREEIAGVDQSNTYHYDEAGNVLSVSDVSRSGTDTQCFTYDYLARLTKAWTQSTSTCATTPSSSTLGGPAPYWSSYTYDLMGNRKTETLHDTTGDTAKDTKRTYAYPDPGTTRPHALSSVTTTGPTGTALDTFAYDDTGNTTTRTLGGTAQALTWDTEGHLAQVTEPVEGGTDKTTEYVYDTDGNRLIGRTPTETTLYLGATEITLPKGSTTAKATRYFDLGGGHQAVQTDNGSVSFTLADHQGTAQLAVDAATQKLTQRRTLPFGGTRGPEPDTWPGTKGFVGGTDDTKATGLTHLGAREYDSSLGRFLSVDPLLDTSDPQSLTGYSYAGNSPVTSNDATGLFCDGCSANNPDTAWTTENGPGCTTSACYDHSGKVLYSTVGKPKSAVTNKSSKTPSGDEQLVLAGVAVPTEEQLRARGYAGYASTTYDSMVMRWSEGMCMMDPGSEFCKAANALGWIRPSSDLLLELTGIPDAVRCAKGSVRGCLWTAAGFLPIGKIGKAAKLLRRGEETASVAARLGATCFKHSFVPGTDVLLADGTTKPIEKIQVGDKIVATDPTTGTTTTREVVATIITEDDKDFVDLTITQSPDTSTNTGASLIATTTHPFWSPSQHAWVNAGDLKPGMTLRTDKGTDARVTEARHFSERQTTHDLTINGTHTYYVLAGATPVLVHNSGPGCGTNWMSSDKLPHHYMRTSDQGVMHAEDFGVKGPYNKVNGQVFIRAIEQFVKNPGTRQIQGTYRGQVATHYVDDTGLHASFAANGPNVGEYLGGWRSSGDQLTYLLRDGKL
ncbi:polymorphic toxin-type HINT domain-containing protein [Streptomyces shenzhenensis]